MDSREEELIRIALENQKQLPPSFLRPLRNTPKLKAAAASTSPFPLKQRYQIGTSTRTYIEIGEWLSEHGQKGHPATIVRFSLPVFR